jgi:hypothetical protein
MGISIKLGVADTQVAILHRISSTLSSELSLDEMLGEVIGLAVRATGSMPAWCT